MRACSNGTTFLHYPPTVVEELRKLDVTKESGDWLTIPQVAKELNRAITWIALRLEIIKAESELRRVMGGQTHLHYPPTVVEELKKLDAVPEAGDWLNVKQITEAVNRHNSWVKRRLEGLEINTETRRTREGMEVPHYPPTAVEELRKLDVTKESGDWLSVKEICTIMNRRNKWVYKQLAKLAVEPEPRLTVARIVALHYPPTVMEELKRVDSG